MIELRTRGGGGNISTFKGLVRTQNNMDYVKDHKFTLSGIAT